MKVLSVCLLVASFFASIQAEGPADSKVRQASAIPTRKTINRKPVVESNTKVQEATRGKDVSSGYSLFSSDPSSSLDEHVVKMQKEQIKQNQNTFARNASAPEAGRPEAFRESLRKMTQDLVKTLGEPKKAAAAGEAPAAGDKAPVPSFAETLRKLNQQAPQGATGASTGGFGESLRKMSQELTKSGGLDSILNSPSMRQASQVLADSLQKKTADGDVASDPAAVKKPSFREITQQLLGDEKVQDILNSDALKNLDFGKILGSLGGGSGQKTDMPDFAKILGDFGSNAGKKTDMSGFDELLRSFAKPSDATATEQARQKVNYDSIWKDIYGDDDLFEDFYSKEL